MWADSREALEGMPRHQAASGQCSWSFGAVRTVLTDVASVVCSIEVVAQEGGMLHAECRTHLGVTGHTISRLPLCLLQWRCNTHMHTDWKLHAGPEGLHPAFAQVYLHAGMTV